MDARRWHARRDRRDPPLRPLVPAGAGAAAARRGRRPRSLPPPLRPPLAAGGKKLQKVGPLEDVVFIDEKARAEARKRAAAEAKQNPFTMSADFKLPGAFALRGKDVQADITGSLHVSVRGPIVG